MNSANTTAADLKIACISESVESTRRQLATATAKSKSSALMRRLQTLENEIRDVEAGR